jgi:hypothetical protein
MKRVDLDAVQRGVFISFVMVMEGQHFTSSGAHVILMRNLKAGMCGVVIHMRFVTRCPQSTTQVRTEALGRTLFKARSPAGIGISMLIANIG